MASLTRETHIPSEMCFPYLGTHIPSDKCSPTGASPGERNRGQEEFFLLVFVVVNNALLYLEGAVASKPFTPR